MKRIKPVFLAVILSGIFLSCHTQKSLASGWDYSESYGQSSDQIVVRNETSSGGFEAKERRVLFSSNFYLAVEEPDTANFYIEKITKKYQGYVNVLGTSRTIIRVKSDYLDSAINDISELGKVTSQYKTGKDVTEDYLDFQIRLENAEKARTRYLELLAKAENVEAALKVEKELERLNATIDLLKGKMNRINHLSEYSTITINLKVKKKPGIIGYVGIGIYRSVKWLFVRN